MLYCSDHPLCFIPFVSVMFGVLRSRLIAAFHVPVLAQGAQRIKNIANLVLRAEVCIIPGNKLFGACLHSDAVASGDWSRNANMEA